MPPPWQLRNRPCTLLFIAWHTEALLCCTWTQKAPPAGPCPTVQYLIHTENAPRVSAVSSRPQVLYLDADSTPLLDPAPLFSTEQYLAAGNLFWPDFYAGDVHAIKAERLFEVCPAVGWQGGGGGPFVGLFVFLIVAGDVHTIKAEWLLRFVQLCTMGWLGGWCWVFQQHVLNSFPLELPQVLHVESPWEQKRQRQFMAHFH